MDNVLSGSGVLIKADDNPIGPLEAAKQDALKFIFGMQTLSTFKALSDRILLLEALMKLPLIQSGSTADAHIAMEQYSKEMEELEAAIIVFCSLPDAPEA